MQQDETGFNGRDIRLELLRRSNHIFIGNKHIFKIQAVSARAFQTAEFRAILQGHAFPLAAGNKHHIAVADLGSIRPNMVFADIGYPRQSAVDFVAALDAFGLQIVFFDTGKVFDGIGHARTGQDFALQNIGQIFGFNRLVGGLMQIPRASRLTPCAERSRAAFFTDFAQYGDLRCQTQTVTALFNRTGRGKTADFAQFQHKFFRVQAFAVDVVHQWFQLAFNECGNIVQ